jgi:hypothetical protein
MLPRVLGHSTQGGTSNSRTGLQALGSRYEGHTSHEACYL